MRTFLLILTCQLAMAQVGLNPTWTWDCKDNYANCFYRKNAGNDFSHRLQDIGNNGQNFVAIITPDPFNEFHTLLFQPGYFDPIKIETIIGESLDVIDVNLAKTSTHISVGYGVEFPNNAPSNYFEIHKYQQNFLNYSSRFNQTFPDKAYVHMAETGDLLYQAHQPFTQDQIIPGVRKYYSLLGLFGNILIDGGLQSFGSGSRMNAAISPNGEFIAAIGQNRIDVVNTITGINDTYNFIHLMAGDWLQDLIVLSDGSIAYSSRPLGNHDYIEVLKMTSNGYQHVAIDLSNEVPAGQGSMKTRIALSPNGETLVTAWWNYDINQTTSLTSTSMNLQVYQWQNNQYIKMDEVNYPTPLTNNLSNELTDMAVDFSGMYPKISLAMAGYQHEGNGPLVPTLLIYGYSQGALYQIGRYQSESSLYVEADDGELFLVSSVCHRGYGCNENRPKVKHFSLDQTHLPFDAYELQAQSNSAGVELRWKLDQNVRGYALFRQSGTTEVQCSGFPIYRIPSGQVQLQGSEYVFTDSTADPSQSYTYALKTFKSQNGGLFVSEGCSNDAQN